MNIKYFDESSNCNLNVELRPGEAMIVNNGGSAEYGISIYLNEKGEFVVQGPFNVNSKKVTFNPKTQTQEQ